MKEKPFPFVLILPAAIKEHSIIGSVIRTLDMEAIETHRESRMPGWLKKVNDKKLYVYINSTGCVFESVVIFCVLALFVVS